MLLLILLAVLAPIGGGVPPGDVPVPLLAGAAEELEEEGEGEDADAGAGEHGVGGDLPVGAEEAAADGVGVEQHGYFAAAAAPVAAVGGGGGISSSSGAVGFAFASWGEVHGCGWLQVDLAFPILYFLLVFVVGSDLAVTEERRIKKDGIEFPRGKVSGMFIYIMYIFT